MEALFSALATLGFKVTYSKAGGILHSWKHPEMEVEVIANYGVSGGIRYDFVKVRIGARQGKTDLTGAVEFFQAACN